MSNIFVVGDIHAGYQETKYYNHKDKIIDFNEEGTLIFLGDFGYPWFGGIFLKCDKNGKTNVIFPERSSELKFFKKMSKRKFKYYVILGNHEGLYRYLDRASLTYDSHVNGFVYIFNIYNKFNNSYYTLNVLKRLGIYSIGGYKFITIGGAYSSDRDRTIGETLWLNESLDPNEIKDFIDEHKNSNIKTILTHTPPLALMSSWVEENLGNEDYDRLIPKFSCTTAKELNTIYFDYCFDIWLFGHLHLDNDEIIDNSLFKCLFKQKPFKLN